ncbi:hypothetical protein [Kiloniella litopenaei]|uniref:hypothetical protein n=1 Tax=Kiloniella litopenaei TaxID=1549748 RepID=UPI003BAB6425
MSRWGLANIEVLASKPYIAGELKRGVPMQQLYDDLYTKKWITVSYNSFRIRARVIKQEITTITNESTPKAPSARHQPKLTKLQSKIEPESKLVPSSREFVLSSISDLTELNREKD